MLFLIGSLDFTRDFFFTFHPKKKGWTHTHKLEHPFFQIGAPNIFSSAVFHGPFSKIADRENQNPRPRF